MTTAAHGAPLSRQETAALIEAMRWQLDPILFTPTTARSLSRLAEVHPDAFRALARLLGETSASPWAPLARKLLGNAEHEEMGDREFALTMATAIARWDAAERLEPTKRPHLGTYLLPMDSEMRACRAAAFCGWLSQQSLNTDDPTRRMLDREDRVFVAEHIDALMDRAEAFRNRPGIDRDLLQRVLDLDTAALADGVL